MKNKYKQIAETSLAIIKSGQYTYKDKIIDVKSKVDFSIQHTFTLYPEELAALREKGLAPLYDKTEIVVKQCSSIQAIMENTELKTCLLNFASAKNPGGGFMGGASAQEESLARSSSLYAALIRDQTLYEYNRKHATFLYSDYMIYSPNVVFWMDDDGAFLPTPRLVDVITAPAPNKGAMLQHNRIEEMQQIASTFRRRIENVLITARSRQIECIVLGAWGCGVFRNEVSDVVAYFKEIIEEKFRNHFKKIVFAVIDRSKSGESYNAFTNAFN